ncbi:uncharacterized protein LOC143303578 [Bombus vancouverensis nearcticus]|uniref:uncharacterized protein LOC143303578 n=1 Tax=Bombus vancouverensis nearcticus TaxID=2705178 RepID=UPI00402B4AA9
MDRDIGDTKRKSARPTWLMYHRHSYGPSTEGSGRKSTWRRSRTPSGSDRKFGNDRIRKWIVTLATQSAIYRKSVRPTWLMYHRHPYGPSTEGSGRNSTWRRSRTPNECMDDGDMSRDDKRM